MFLKVDYRYANLIGYIVGLINSFYWNRRWVFNSKNKKIIKEALLFLFIFFVCYGIQFIALNLLIQKVELNKYLAQFLGMAVYTLLNFLLNKNMTFRHKSKVKEDVIYPGF